RSPSLQFEPPPRLLHQPMPPDPRLHADSPVAPRLARRPHHRPRPSNTTPAPESPRLSPGLLARSRRLAAPDPLERVKVISHGVDIPSMEVEASVLQTSTMKTRSRATMSKP
ncbi:unnamed protein product, partial [Urochloa humidicola]